MTEQEPQKIEIPKGATVIIKSAPSFENQDKHDKPLREQSNPETDAMIRRNLGGWVAGGVAAFAGWMGAEIYMTGKLRSFETAVNDLVRKDIMARSSAGIAEGLGGLGVGSSQHALRDAHYMNLIESGKYPLASKIYNIGGRGTVAIAAAMAAGAAGYYLYKMVAPKNDPAVLAVEKAKLDPATEEIKEFAKDGTKANYVDELAEEMHKAKDDPEARKAAFSKWEEKIAERKAEAATDKGAPRSAFL